MLSVRMIVLYYIKYQSSLTEPDPYAGGEGLVNCYASTRTIGMHLRHRATHICDVTIGLIVLLVH